MMKKKFDNIIYIKRTENNSQEEINTGRSQTNTIYSTF